MTSRLFKLLSATVALFQTIGRGSMHADLHTSGAKCSRRQSVQGYSCKTLARNVGVDGQLKYR